MAKILDGKIIAAQIKDKLHGKISSLSTVPGLAIVLATNDESALAYASAIKKSGEKTGIKIWIHNLQEGLTDDILQNKIKSLAANEEVNGIIIQSPLPEEVDADKARSFIPPGKDIDGANPLSFGRLSSGLEAFAPATAQAVIEILNYYDINPAGKHAVVIGRSMIIGKPVANLLLGMDATVTICHSRTTDLAVYTKQAEILVVAVGQSGLVGKDHINENKRTVVIDVGTNFDKAGNMSGDVKFDEVKDLSGAITPVPGGVGPVTTAILLRNTLEAYLKQTEK